MNTPSAHPARQNGSVEPRSEELQRAANGRLVPPWKVRKARQHAKPVPADDAPKHAPLPPKSPHPPIVAFTPLPLRDVWRELGIFAFTAERESDAAGVLRGHDVAAVVIVAGVAEGVGKVVGGFGVPALGMTTETAGRVRTLRDLIELVAHSRQCERGK
jgi:hypothetical protein